MGRGWKGNCGGCTPCFQRRRCLPWHSERFFFSHFFFVHICIWDADNLFLFFIFFHWTINDNIMRSLKRESFIPSLRFREGSKIKHYNYLLFWFGVWKQWCIVLRYVLASKNSGNFHKHSLHVEIFPCLWFSPFLSSLILHTTYDRSVHFVTWLCSYFLVVLDGRLLLSQ